MITQTAAKPAPATIFIVDDESAVRKGLARLVRAAGYEAQAFASAREFLDRSNRETVSCIACRRCTRTIASRCAKPYNPRTGF